MGAAGEQPGQANKQVLPTAHSPALHSRSGVSEVGKRKGSLGVDGGEAAPVHHHGPTSPKAPNSQLRTCFSLAPAWMGANCTTVPEKEGTHTSWGINHRSAVCLSWG